MAEKTLSTRIALCSKTESEWQNDTTIILDGELAISSDTKKIKVGDGKKAWSGLAYANYSPSEIDTLISNAKTELTTAINGKANSSHTHSYLPLSGGAMGSGAYIQFPDSGNWSNSNTGVTFPVDRGGIKWSGQSDGITLRARETANDNLELELYFTDDNSNGLSFLNKDGTTTAKIKSTGDATFGTVTASLNGNAVSASKLQTARTITLSGALSGSASFDGTDNITITTSQVDASQITTGTVSIDRLPHGALERLIVVADQAARYKLTNTNVQNGDTVKETSTGLMYYVKDDTKLSSEAGYEIYTAGSATSVPWSGVTGKPSTFTPSSHTHSYLPLSGGTLSGDLQFKIGDMSKARAPVQMRAGNDSANGDAVLVGAGGMTIIGSGESADTIATGYANTLSSESLHLAADDTIYFHTSCQDGFDTRKSIGLNQSLAFYPTTKKIGAIGTANYPFESMTACAYRVTNGNTTSVYSARIETAGTSSVEGDARVVIGNSIAKGTADNSTGSIFIYNSGSNWNRIAPSTTTSNITITLPSSSGTLSLEGHTHSYLPLSGGTVTGTLILSRTQDAAGGANNKPALIVGGADTAAHMEIDANEILAKSNGTTPVDLHLNTDGGNVIINSNNSGKTYTFAVGSSSNANTTTKLYGSVNISGLTTVYNSIDITGSLRYRESDDKQISIIKPTKIDENGCGLRVGGGAWTIIGAGESGGSMESDASGENLYMIADNAMYFYTGANTYANKKGIILNSSLSFYPATKNTGTIGTTGNPFNSIVATGIAAYDSNAKVYGRLRVVTVGTASVQGEAQLSAGNDIATGTAGNARGTLYLYNAKGKYNRLYPSEATTDIAITLPSSTGTLALTSQVPKIYSGTTDPAASTGANGDLYIKFV